MSGKYQWSEFLMLCQEKHCLPDRLSRSMGPWAEKWFHGVRQITMAPSDGGGPQAFGGVMVGLRIVSVLER